MSLTRVTDVVVVVLDVVQNSLLHGLWRCTSAEVSVENLCSHIIYRVIFNKHRIFENAIVQ